LCLNEAILSGTDLSGTALNGAKYSTDTKLPPSFDPKAAGMVLAK
jgi:uncharacterized protein YjbI with pentapeptide repeats